MFSKKVRLGVIGILAFGLGTLICINVLTNDEKPDKDVSLVVSESVVEDSYSSLSLQPERQMGPTEVVPAEALNPAQTEIINHRYVQTLSDGKRVTYSLIPTLQKRAGELLRKNEVAYGAVVAINPKDGRVLALVDYRHGHPDADGFALKASQPAASIFKIVTTAALMEIAGITPDQQICYHGGSRGITKDLLTPNPLKDTLCKNLGEAFAHSTNTIFARLMDQHLEKSALEKWAARFAFNVEIPFLWRVDRSATKLPNSRVKLAAAAAGFHHTYLSPFHASLIAAAIGNRGQLLQPRIVEKIEDRGIALYSHKPLTLGNVVGPHTSRKLTAMMLKTTEEGTASRYFGRASSSLNGISVAGKTGSLSSPSPDGVRRHNSWFIGFAPAENPEIAIAALVVNDPKWRTKGTLVAREMLETYFALPKVPPPTVSGKLPR